MRDQFRFNAVVAIISGMVSCVMLPCGWAQSTDVLGPPEPEFPVVEETTGEPNLEGVANSIILEDSALEISEELDLKDVPTDDITDVPSTVADPQVPAMPVASAELASSTKTGREGKSVDGTVAVPLAEVGKERLLSTEIAKKNAPRIAQLAQNAKVPIAQSENISIARRLLEQLSPSQETYLEGVEAVDLRTFLNSPRLQSDPDAVRSLLPTYWKTSMLRSVVFYWQQRKEALEALLETASVTDRPLYEAGIVAAQSNLVASKIALRLNAIELGQQAGYTREVTAQTQPHAGSYDTRYEAYRSVHGESSAEITYLDGLLTIHQEQLTATAAAYTTTEKLLKLQVKQGAGAGAILTTWDMLNERREAFFVALMSYNEDILNYVLKVSFRRGPNIAPLLVRPVTEVSVGDTKSPTRTPSLPTAPQETTPTPTTEEASVDEASMDEASMGMESVVEEHTVGDNISNAGASALSPPVLSEPEPVYPENATVDIVPSGSDAVDGGIVEGDAPYLELPESNMLFPNSEMSVPTTETPSPENEFVPIGGETGVDTNPTNGLPSGSIPLGASGTKDSFIETLENGEMIQQITARYPAVGTESGRQSVLENVEQVAEPLRQAPKLNGIRDSITLEEVLDSTSPPNQERAVHVYWRYAMFHKQMCVLEYQQQILNRVSRRLLLDSLQSFSPTTSLLIELQYLILRSELLSMRSLAWKELYILEHYYLDEKPVFPGRFPVAQTEMKAEAFQVSLDRYAPGSSQDMRTLPLARHLYFCASQLPITFANIMAFSDYIVAPIASEKEGKKEDFLSRLDHYSEPELEIFFKTLLYAREASFRYFQLLYFMNKTYTSCILDGGHTIDSTSELAKMLAN